MYKYRNPKAGSSQNDLSFPYIELFLDELNLTSKNKSSRKLFKHSLKSLFHQLRNRNGPLAKDYSEDLLALVDKSLLFKPRKHILLLSILLLSIVIVFTSTLLWGFALKIPLLVFGYACFGLLDLLTYRSHHLNLIRAANYGLEDTFKVSNKQYESYLNNHLKRTYYGRWYIDLICIVWLLVSVVLSQNVYKF